MAEVDALSYTDIHLNFILISKKEPRTQYPKLKFIPNQFYFIPKNFFIFENIPPLSSSRESNGTDSPKMRLAIFR